MSSYHHEDSIREVLTNYVRQELSYGAERLDPEADLIDQGIIDSMSLLRLISFLEERFAIEVRDQDLVPDNFRSLAAIESFLARARATN